MRFISYLIIFIMIIIFFSPANMYDTGSEPVNYLTRTTYHANLNHLALNMISLYGLSFIEDVIGRGQFFFAILFIWIVSSLLLYIYHLAFPSRKVYTVGFSGVIFGLIVVYYFLMNVGQKYMIYAFIGSIIPQLFIPRLSIEGHIFGIIAGFIYVYLFPVTDSNSLKSLE